jgi:hypothetical protein
MNGFKETAPGADGNTCHKKGEAAGNGIPHAASVVIFYHHFTLFLGAIQRLRILFHKLAAWLNAAVLP